MRIFKWLAAGAGIGAAAYGAYVATTWWRYGRARPAQGGAHDDLLDRFMPRYDVYERHAIDVAAPADVTLAAAKDFDLESSRIVRAIFKGRELILRSSGDGMVRPKGLFELTKSLGWAVLAEAPNEIVMGAVTRPWEANPVFRPIAPDKFEAFAEPGFVKIAWTLRADPAEEGHSRFRTETRAVATDPEARRKFRRYWAFLSPGITLIRAATMRPLADAAEHTWRQEADAAFH